MESILVRCHLFEWRMCQLPSLLSRVMGKTVRVNSGIGDEI